MEAEQQQQQVVEAEPPEVEAEADDLFPEGALCESCVLDEDAVAYCRECKQLLCEDCLAFHRRGRGTSQHETVESQSRAEELRRLYSCKEHQDQRLDYFCKTCNTAVCKNCQVTCCKEHQVAVSTEVRGDVRELLEKVKVKREEFLQHTELIRAREAQNMEAFTQCESEITQGFSELARVLEERKRELLLKLREETERNEERVRQQREFVENTIREMEQTIERAEALIGTKKEAKLMVNKVKVSCDLEGRALHDWNKQNATYRRWRLDHREQREHAEKFGQLLPCPRSEDVEIRGLEGPLRVGAMNSFTVRADIRDQLLGGGYDPATVTNFLSVLITFTPGHGKPATNVQRKITRDENVWSVSFVLRYEGAVTISIALCGVELREQTLATARREAAVGMLVTRGPDWKWDNQDGGRGCRGRVRELRKQQGWVTVMWETTGGQHDYRWGAQDSYDLEVVQEG